MSVESRPPLIVRDIRFVAPSKGPWGDAAEPRYLWLGGHPVLIYTDLVSGSHEPKCFASSREPPTIRKADHFRRYCERCQALLQSIGLWWFDIETGQRGLLTAGLCANTWLDLAPSGQRLAFTSAEDLKIHDIGVATLDVRQITRGPGEHVKPLYLRDDLLCYVHVGERISGAGLAIRLQVRIDDVARQRPMHVFENLFGGLVASDVTRRHIAILNKQTLILLNHIDDFTVPEVKELALPHGWTPSRLVMSPAQSVLIIGCYDDDFVCVSDMFGDFGPGYVALTFDISNGSRPIEPSFSGNAAWSPDGRMLADPTSGIYSSRSGALFPMAPAPGGRPVWSTSGDKLLLDRSGAIWAANPDSSQLQYLTEGTDPKPSACDRYVAFMRGTSLNVMRVEPA